MNNYHVTTKTSGYMNKPGVTIHKSNSLEITFYSQMYGETNVVNVVLKSILSQYEDICVYSNGTRLFSVFWKKNSNEKEKISTTFETATNKFTKNETISYAPQYYGCTNYDIVQTYVLTNVKITDEFYNESLEKISSYSASDDILRITPQDRTIMTGLTTLWSYDGYAEHIAHQLNSTTYRSDETLVIVGINYDRRNYVQYNDLKMGMITIANSTNAFFFNVHTSTILPEIARISLNLIKSNLGETAQTIIISLKNTAKTYVYTNNETHLMKLYSPTLENVHIILNTSSGIISSIIILDNFEYNGAISDPLVPEETNENTFNPVKKISTMTCFEDNCRNNGLEKSKTLYNLSTDSKYAFLKI